MLWKCVAREVAHRKFIPYDVRSRVDVTFRDRPDILERCTSSGNDRTLPPRSTSASTGVFFSEIPAHGTATDFFSADVCLVSSTSTTLLSSAPAIGDWVMTQRIR